MLFESKTQNLSIVDTKAVTVATEFTRLFVIGKKTSYLNIQRDILSILNLNWKSNKKQIFAEALKRAGEAALADGSTEVLPVHVEKIMSQLLLGNWSSSSSLFYSELSITNSNLIFENRFRVSFSNYRFHLRERELWIFISKLYIYIGFDCIINIQ